MVNLVPLRSHNGWQTLSAKRKIEQMIVWIFILKTNKKTYMEGGVFSVEGDDGGEAILFKNPLEIKTDQIQWLIDQWEVKNKKQHKFWTQQRPTLN